MIRPILLLPCLMLPATALAQDGGQLYTLYCSACHGLDGKGATGGQFPPLAESPWIAGDAERPIRVVLHGLHGPVDVNGRTFDLEMPPQGAALPDENIAAILTYIRSSWGNTHAAVTPADVAKVRADQASRKIPWTAEELLRDLPLPLEKSALSDLISRTYEWDEKWLPDLTKLDPLNTEEEHDGLLSVHDSTRKDKFGLVWDGRFEAPASGIYEFMLDADDGAAVFINDNKVVEIEGVGPMDGSRAKIGRIRLEAGRHSFRTQYFESSGDEGISLAWRIEDTDRWHWLSDERSKIREPLPPIAILPEDGRPVIYRNFVDGTTPRSIAVGFPSGVNLAYSADHLAPELIWTGDFIDGGPKWRSRGTETSPPAGEHLVKLSSTPAWPEGARFHGYELDAAGNPTFIVTLGKQVIRDHFEASDGKLIRHLSLNAGNPVKLLISNHGLDGQLAVTIDGNPAPTPTLLLAPGTTTLTYRWK